jgi:hypothetical protein
VVSLVGYDWVEKPTIFANFPNGNLLNLQPWGIAGANPYYPIPSHVPQILSGITNISIISNDGGGAWATFQITSPVATTTVSNYVPVDTVVIPTTATGNVQIILESSSDLVNWTAASPGIYGASSATNRFFRVRAEIQ